MIEQEAILLLLEHGSGRLDEAGDIVWRDDGFLGMLRPYRGLREENFHVVMQALFVVGERLHVAEKVDRQLIHSLWSTSQLMRLWGLAPNGMLQRNKLITAEDTRRLADWVYIFESCALGLLGGRPPTHQVERYAQYIVDFGPGENIDFFIPLMCQSLDDPDQSNPTVIATALGKLGPVAKDALPSLRAANERKYHEHCDAEAHEGIAEAIRRIESGT